MTHNPNNFMVRWITRWDREAVTLLMTKLAGQHGVTPDQETLEEAFEHALREPDELRFCVAVRDGEIIGQASLNRAYSSWRARHFGTIEDVYVEEEARRQGVAKAMFDFLIQQARRREYCCVRLDVQADNDGARAFYADYGLLDSGYVVYELDLDEE